MEKSVIYRLTEDKASFLHHSNRLRQELVQDAWRTTLLRRVKETLKAKDLEEDDLS